MSKKKLQREYKGNICKVYLLNANLRIIEVNASLKEIKVGFVYTMMKSKIEIIIDGRRRWYSRRNLLLDKPEDVLATRRKHQNQQPIIIIQQSNFMTATRII